MNPAVSTIQINSYMLLFELFKLLETSESSVIWRPVAGWDKYEVSNTGIVRVKRTQRVVSAWDHTRRGTTYKRVTLRDNGQRTNARVHRLVALAFLPTPPPGATEVDHRNGDSLDNTPGNLEWVSGQENLTRMHDRKRDPNTFTLDKKVA